jgi:uncharacterized membrane protein
MKFFECTFYIFVIGIFALFLAVLFTFNSKAEEACKEKGGIVVRTTQGYTCIDAKAVKEIK